MLFRSAGNAEESAAASEEMNAQAEQLREYVGDLVMMVTGNRDQKIAMISHRAVKTVPLQIKSQELGKNKILAHHDTEVRPDQVIPFDHEENFKDF